MTTTNRLIALWETYPEGHPARSNADYAFQQFYDNTVKLDGVVRWKSNGSVPPQEILEFWQHVRFRFNMAKSVAARNKDEKEFLARYAQAQRNQPPSAELMHELRANHPPGTVIQDVVTGRKIRL